MKYTSLLLLSIFCLTTAHSQVIVTVAGNGVESTTGDGGPATDATLFDPRGVALDNSGNLYICQNGGVRKVAPAYGGIITTVVGSGISGFSGDGGPAYFAKVNGVFDVAVDHSGNIYVADAGNNRIRKVTTDGIINTIAGTGIAGYNGDNIPATAAQLNSPYGITVDDTGSVYISDSKNRRIRKIDTFGIITTVAGTGVKGFSGDGGIAAIAQLHRPKALRFDNAGNLYFTDSTRIRMIGTTGIISTVAGVATFGFSGDGGPATSAEIIPAAILLDSGGNLFIADDYRIRKVNEEGHITTIAGTGTSIYNGDGMHPLLTNMTPSGIAMGSAGEIFISDMGNDRVRMISYTLANSENPAMNKTGMRVSPNPSHGDCTLYITTPASEKANITITNVTGSKVSEFEAASNQEVSLPAGHLPCGIYIIQASTQQERFTCRWIIK